DLGLDLGRHLEHHRGVVEQPLAAVELADVVEGLVVLGGDVDALPVGLDGGLEAVDGLVELLALEVLGAGVVELDAGSLARGCGHHFPPAIFLRISPVVTLPTSRFPRRTYAPRAPAWQ